MRPISLIVFSYLHVSTCVYFRICMCRLHLLFSQFKSPSISRAWPQLYICIPTLNMQRSISLFVLTTSFQFNFPPHSSNFFWFPFSFWFQFRFYFGNFLWFPFLFEQLLLIFGLSLNNIFWFQFPSPFWLNYSFWFSFSFFFTFSGIFWEEYMEYAKE